MLLLASLRLQLSPRSCFSSFSFFVIFCAIASLARLSLAFPRDQAPLQQQHALTVAGDDYSAYCPQQDRQKVVVGSRTFVLHCDYSAGLVSDGQETLQECAAACNKITCLGAYREKEDDGGWCQKLLITPDEGAAVFIPFLERETVTATATATTAIPTTIISTSISTTTTATTVPTTITSTTISTTASTTTSTTTTTTTTTIPTTVTSTTISISTSSTTSTTTTTVPTTITSTTTSTTTSISHSTTTSTTTVPTTVIFTTTSISHSTTTIPTTIVSMTTSISHSTITTISRVPTTIVSTTTSTTTSITTSTTHSTATSTTTSTTTIPTTITSITTSTTTSTTISTTRSTTTSTTTSTSTSTSTYTYSYISTTTVTRPAPEPTFPTRNLGSCGPATSTTVFRGRLLALYMNCHADLTNAGIIAANQDADICILGSIPDTGYTVGRFDRGYRGVLGDCYVGNEIRWDSGRQADGDHVVHVLSSSTIAGADVSSEEEEREHLSISNEDLSLLLGDKLVVQG